MFIYMSCSLSSNSNCGWLILLAQRHLNLIDGPGGTGKTFLYNLLLGRVCCEGHVALVVASSGIVALLLDGGRTAHSRFKIPVGNLHENSTS